jgi:hypothetical protein
LSPDREEGKFSPNNRLRRLADLEDLVISPCSTPRQWVDVSLVSVCFGPSGPVIADGKDAGSKKDVSFECGAEHFVDFQTEKDVAGKINELTEGGCHVA